MTSPKKNNQINIAPVPPPPPPSESLDDDSKTKHKRRKRDDQINRNYICGCGKSYLSYPALYTHLKQKHNGKKPPETDIPKKKREIKPIPSDNFQFESPIKEEDEKIEDFLGYLNGYENYLRKNNIESNLLFDPIKNGSDQVNSSIDFPTHLFHDSIDYIAILRKIEQMQSNNLDMNKKLNCNEIFSFFLIKITKFVTKHCFNELVIFVCLFRKTINQIKMKENHKKEDFCENNGAENILDLANEFIITYLPKFLKEFDLRHFFILGNNEEKRKNCIFLTQYFGNWLYVNNFTIMKLERNVD